MWAAVTVLEKALGCVFIRMNGYKHSANLLAQYSFSVYHRCEWFGVTTSGLMKYVKNLKAAKILLLQ